MKFRSFDGLKVFDMVARCRSFTRAGEELGLTKAAISYQINKLEDQLGFKVFERGQSGVSLTQKGEALWQVARENLSRIERCVHELRGDAAVSLHLRLSTYFASRWLSPRLMTFMKHHPDIRITLEPAIDPGEFESIHDTLAIRWGQGTWSGTHNEFLFESFSRPMCSPALYQEAEKVGLDAFLKQVPLLHDAAESTAWEGWFDLGNHTYSRRSEELVIKDPNVRAQAVIDGQGIALYDQLVQQDIDSNRLQPLSNIGLRGYGYYLCYPRAAVMRPEVHAFRDWILAQSEEQRTV